METAFPGYPFARRHAAIGGLSMHYAEHGPPDAPPVIMLHGNPTWSYHYRVLLQGLGDRHRSIAPDHVGMGLSARPGPNDYPFTLARRIDDVESLLTEVGVRGAFDLVVHDWGGAIGLGLAVRHPERVRRLVVMNTAAFHRPRDAPVPWPIRLARGPLGELLVRRANAFCAGAARACTVRGLPPAVRHAYLFPYRRARERLGVLRFVQDIPLEPADASYGTLSEIEAGLVRLRHVPVLLLWGMRDFVFGPAFLARWEALFPAARRRCFADGGHYLLEDHPEAVLAEVEAFLGDAA